MTDKGPSSDTPNPNHTVFISSTFLDNEERRKLVEDAILRAKMLPIGMERFTASTRATVEECQRENRPACLAARRPLVAWHGRPHPHQCR